MLGNDFINLSLNMIKKRFSEPVLDTTLIVCIWWTENMESDVMVYWEYVDEDRTLSINTDEIKTEKIFMSTLAHELLHFVGYNLRRKWIDHTTLTEEIYCYLYDFYFGRIYEWIKKKKLMKNLK